MKVDDVILGVDGRDMDSVDALHLHLGLDSIGRDATIKVLRGTTSPQVVYVTVRPAERSDD